MKCWIILILIATTIVAVGGTRYPDYSLAKLVENNALLTEINVQRQKVANLIERWGIFFGYVLPDIEWFYETYGTSHSHSDQSPTAIIETESVARLEKLNGYLDYVIDTTTMDSITS